jgi:hypothetical protein
VGRGNGNLISFGEDFREKVLKWQFAPLARRCHSRNAAHERVPVRLRDRSIVRGFVSLRKFINCTLIYRPRLPSPGDIRYDVLPRITV